MTYELRTYTAADGKMQDLLDRFRNHTINLFERHGMDNLGYWHPVGRPDQLVYLLRHNDDPTKTWAEFKEDPDWAAAKLASEAGGPIVADMSSVYLKESELRSLVPAFAEPANSAAANGATATSGQVQLFEPLDIRGVTFPNRIVVSPMCMYSSGDDGKATAWHEVHLGSRAAGGAGTVFTEATGITPEGRITNGDLGIWSDDHIPGLSELTSFIKAQGSVPGIQLAHAGRKGGRTIPWAGNEPLPRDQWGPLYAPSPIPFRDEWGTPQEMTADDIANHVRLWGDAAHRAQKAGFEVIELHFGHGYLVHQFLSPLSNHREDAYGGDVERRARFAVEITAEVRRIVGEQMPIFARLSVVDWADGGIHLDDSIRYSALLRQAGADLIDCSSGAVVPDEKVPVEPLYQVAMSRTIREEAGILTGAVGVITTPQQGEQVLKEGAADLVFLGRSMLRDAYWARAAARELGAVNPVEIPLPYRRAVQRMEGRTQW